MRFIRKVGKRVCSHVYVTCISTRSFQDNYLFFFFQFSPTHDSILDVFFPWTLCHLLFPLRSIYTQRVRSRGRRGLGLYPGRGLTLHTGADRGTQPATSPGWPSCYQEAISSFLRRCELMVLGLVNTRGYTHARARTRTWKHAHIFINTYKDT